LNASFRKRSFLWNRALPDSHYARDALWYRSGPGCVAGPPIPVEIKVDQVVT
jgi:hypothetical protein